MQIPANQPDQLNETTPITAQGNKVNIYDDPLSAFIETGLYKLLLFVLSCQSISVLVFLRYRIGLRQMRMWVFFLLFVLLGGYSFVFGGGWLSLLALFSGGVNPSGFDGSLILFSIAMLAVAFCRNQIAKELVEHPTHPLHTMARGNSYLTSVLSQFPPLHGIWWHFTTRQVIRPRIFPLNERAVQTLAEPLLLFILGLILVFLGSAALGTWLILSAVSLRIVEYDYYLKGETAYYDMKDAQIEAKVMKAMRDPGYFQQEAGKDGKIGGIAVVSEELQQMRQRRLNRRA